MCSRWTELRDELKELDQEGAATVPVVEFKVVIDGLQPIPRESKDMADMLDVLTIEADEEYFVIVLQHGGSDVI